MTYDYDLLVYLIGQWWGMERSRGWAKNGYAPCAPIHRHAVTSRQWDSASTVLDDTLDRATADIIGDAIAALPQKERSIIMVNHCGRDAGPWSSMIVAAIPAAERPLFLQRGMDAVAKYVMDRGVTL